MISAPIVIEETAGIDRFKEPVTMGIPFCRGLVKDASSLILRDSRGPDIPLQAQVLAVWPDNSLKWVLLDFQITISKKSRKELELVQRKSGDVPENASGLSIEVDKDHFIINSVAASFFLNKHEFKPFDRVLVEGSDLLNRSGNRIGLVDEFGNEYRPLIDSIFLETEGHLRTTIKGDGSFRSENNRMVAAFFSRINFFVNKSAVSIEFTILNPKAAKHPGGLWDLGDPGSFFFKELSIQTAMKTNPASLTKSFELYEDPVPMIYQHAPADPTCHQLDSSDHLLIYQDSSGGENWRSKNHVNRYNEVKTSFRGFRIFKDDVVIQEGNRANPIVSIIDGSNQISGGVQHFWQNFPKAMDIRENILTISLFPSQFNDVFELQGGEQKTHKIFLEFKSLKDKNSGLKWIQSPIIARSTPEWYSMTKAFRYLIPEHEDPNTDATNLIRTAIDGKNTFFHRREIIDEYGWRNFGEFYADHEAAGNESTEPLISHYNNQYDCIYACLNQFARNGDFRWFLLADQLCTHVKDIDIYHTDDDRPENNRGLFWHTEHYIDAQTATHRCFSEKHSANRDMSIYGGGPSLSHNYSSGLLLHYFMTGTPSSREAFLELVNNAINCIDIASTISSHLVKFLRKAHVAIKKNFKKNNLVELNKVYGLEGPGRGSGNALNTFLDAYILTDDKAYLKKIDKIILDCVKPDDNIDNKDLLDVENRWMYTIFLQSLGKYLDVKVEKGQFDNMWTHAKESLVHYSKWVANNEHLYLAKPEKLEFPNETWAAQDIRKCNILLYASKYADQNLSKLFVRKAMDFYYEPFSTLCKFPTRFLLRPMILTINNASMLSHFNANSFNDEEYYKTNQSKADKNSEKPLAFAYPKTSVFNIIERLLSFSVRKEISYLKWRILSRL